MESLKKIGAVSEDRAAAYLAKSGYAILERNYRDGRFGEVDIIALDAGELVGVEVKCVNPAWDDDCIASKVPKSKYNKIRNGLRGYCHAAGMDFAAARVDVILVRPDKMFHYKDVEL